MATLYENNASGTSNSGWWAEDWGAQTFTPAISHKCTHVILRLYRTGTPGTPGNIAASIRSTDGDGLPTGADLAYGTTDGDTLTTNTDGAQRQFTFSIPINLDAGTTYAIVLRAPAGDVNSQLHWKQSSTNEASVYPGGSSAESFGDSGITWAFIVRDYHFEEWGTLGLTTGWIWIEGKRFYYIDEFGTERFLVSAGAPSQSGEAEEGADVTYGGEVVTKDGSVVYT